MTPKEFCESRYLNFNVKELQEKKNELKEWDNGKKGHFWHEVICWIDKRIAELS